MIRSYQDFLERRWNELGMPAKIHAAADVEDVQRPIQVPWMVQVAGELRHTTLHEGRRHPDVGLLFKATGNLFNANGLTISTDVICVRETNDAGEVTDPNAIATVDVIITSLRHAAHPGWLVTGRLAGADIARFRDPPVPAGTVPDETGKVDDTGGGGITLPRIDNEALRALVQIAAQLQEIRTAQEADRAIQERIAAGIEGLRRDVGNAGKLLGALVAGGGLGNLADLIKPQKT